MIVFIILKQLSIMGTIIFKIEITENEAVIFEMTPGGKILSSEETTPSVAKSFASMYGLSCMDDNGDVRYYW